jgi:hypothetical protein
MTLGTFPAVTRQEVTMTKTLLIAGLLAATPVLAADPVGSAAPVPSGAQNFMQLDLNRDGFLSFSESFPNPRAANSFNALDTNADGLLSPLEFAAVFR